MKLSKEQVFVSESPSSVPGAVPGESYRVRKGEAGEITLTPSSSGEPGIVAEVDAVRVTELVEDLFVSTMTGWAADEGGGVILYYANDDNEVFGVKIRNGV